MIYCYILLNHSGKRGQVLYFLGPIPPTIIKGSIIYVLVLGGKRVK